MQRKTYDFPVVEEPKEELKPIYDNLVMLGFSLKTASILNHIYQHPDSSVRDICSAVNVLQPEVSLTISKLEFAFVSKYGEKKDIRGRRPFKYSLNLKCLVDRLEEQEKERQNKINKAFETIKNIAE